VLAQKEQVSSEALHDEHIHTMLARPMVADWSSGHEKALAMLPARAGYPGMA